MLYPNGIHLRVELSAKSNGILFEGETGRIFVNRKRLAGKPVSELRRNPLPPDAIHLGNHVHSWGTMNDIHVLEFFHCVKTGAQPISDVVSQHRSATACHLANISMRLGRKLTWDPHREEFVNDPEASAMLSRPQRANL